MPRPSSIRGVSAKLWLGAVLLASNVSIFAASSCHIGTFAQHVEVKNRTVIIDGAANERPIRALVDTGAAFTSLDHKFVKDASLVLLETQASAYGVGGQSRLDRTFVKTLAFGPITAESVQVLVVMDRSAQVSWDAILGADILFNNDLEMALADGELRIVIADGCHDDFLAYWDREASALPMSRLSYDDHRQVITLQINDRDVRAVIDTGADTSVIDEGMAARAGVTRDSINVLKEGKSGGIGPGKVDWWIAPFHKVVIGRESITDTRIRVADLRGAGRLESDTSTMIRRREDPGYDMILGADFIKAHRVLFSIKQKKFYFSYVGGRIFAIDR